VSAYSVAAAHLFFFRVMDFEVQDLENVMNPRTCSRFWAALVSATLLGSTSQAALITTFTTLGSYETSLGGSTVVETFNGGHLNGTLISSVTGGSQYFSNALYGVAGPINTSSQYARLDFSQPITNFAFDFGDLGINPFFSLPEKARIFLFSGPIHQAELTIVGFPNGFFGLSSDTAFDHVTIADATYNVDPEFDTDFWIDNFRVVLGGSGGGGGGGGTPSPSLPEPSSWLLALTGLATVIWKRRLVAVTSFAKPLSPPRT
jgi:hypothetical protein